ncbi:MAG: hypothetical protein PWR17_1247 [Candidatus Methanomethylophilaceae archaeon]|nr:hypothetical protein [Candidatus Methanomethylophilaceae archaeon]
MAFNPLITSKHICDTYRRYILSTFETDSEKYNQQLRNILEKDDTIMQGPYVQIAHNYPSSVRMQELIDQGLLSKEFVRMNYRPFLDRKLYIHQEAAIRKINEGRNIVVSTGTGSGKTECFLIPVLNHLMREKENGTLCPGVRIMLLYPLNALVNDQLERMRDVLKNYPDITFGTFNIDTKETKAEANARDNGLVNRLPNEIYDRETFRKTPPHIMITNYAMLEHLLIKPNNSPLFGDPVKNHWRFIVLDEAHTYGGSKGSEVSMLLRRLKTTLGKDNIRFILTSATLGNEGQDAEVADFASKLCSSEFHSEDVIRAQYIPMQEPDVPVSLGLEFYGDVSKIVEGHDVEGRLADYLKQKGFCYDEPRKNLYDLIYNDPLIHRLVEILDKSP